MQRFISSIILSSLAFVLISSSTGSASSGIGLSVDEGELGDITASSGAVTFGSPETEMFIVCPVTLRLSLHGSLPKTSGSLAGTSTLAFGEANCEGGRLRGLAGVQHVRYVEFAGTLPSITVVYLDADVALLLNYFGGLLQCLYMGSWRLATIQTGNSVTGIVIAEEVEVPLSRRLFGVCPQNLVQRGELQLAPNVRLSLI